MTAEQPAAETPSPDVDERPAPTSGRFRAEARRSVRPARSRRAARDAVDFGGDLERRRKAPRVPPPPAQPADVAVPQTVRAPVDRRSTTPPVERPAGVVEPEQGEPARRRRGTPPPERVVPGLVVGGARGIRRVSPVGRR